MDALNLELRKDVLKVALSLEKAVNNLLVSYLDIENKKTRALTHKSGGLSFKNKIDLLYDIDVLNNEEYSDFLLVMEIRNQFMHNYECNSFEDVLSLLGSDKRKRLITKLDNTNNYPDEVYYKSCFYKLHYQILDIVIIKYQNKIDDLKDRHEVFNHFSDHANKILNEFSLNLTDTLFEIFKSDKFDNQEDKDLYDNIASIIGVSIIKNLKKSIVDNDSFSSSEIGKKALKSLKIQLNKD